MAKLKTCQTATKLPLPLNSEAADWAGYGDGGHAGVRVSRSNIPQGSAQETD